MTRFSLLLLSSLTLAAPALAGDLTVTLPANDGFVMKDNTGSTERLRVDEATGNVWRNGSLFVHTTGTDNTFVGENAGNLGTAGFAGMPRLERELCPQMPMVPVIPLSERTHCPPTPRLRTREWRLRRRC